MNHHMINEIIVDETLFLETKNFIIKIYPPESIELDIRVQNKTKQKQTNNNNKNSAAVL